MAHLRTISTKLDPSIHQRFCKVAIAGGKVPGVLLRDLIEGYLDDDPHSAAIDDLTRRVVAIEGKLKRLSED